MSKIKYGDAPWILFFFFPFAAFIASLKNFKSSWAKNVFWAFVIFYGATFGLSAEDKNSATSSADINRYISQFQYLHQYVNSFNELIKVYNDSDEFDFFSLFINFIISRFTNQPQILTTVYAIIFGFFYSRNIWFILSRIKNKMKVGVIVFTAVLILINPMWNLNGFRFWTATHIYIYGIFLFLFEKKYIGLIISPLSIVVHFSFVLPVLLIASYFILRNRFHFITILFIFSNIFSQINIASVNTFIEANVSEKVQKRTKGYRSEENVELYRKGELNIEVKTANWYVTAYFDGLIWFLKIALIFLYFRKRKLLKSNPLTLSLYTFAMLLFTFANVMASVPSGARFLTIAAFLSVSFLILFWQYSHIDLGLLRLFYLGLFPLILFFVVSVRLGFYTISVNTFLGNPVTTFLTDNNISMNDIIKPETVK